MEIEVFSVTQSITACSIALRLMDDACILSSSAPVELKNLAYEGYFSIEGGCWKIPTDGAVCVNTSIAMRIRATFGSGIDPT